MQLGDPSGVEEMLRSLEVARAAGRPDDVMMVYLSLVPLLWRDGRYGEVARHAEEWADYARDRDFPTTTRRARPTGTACWRFVGSGTLPRRV
jgi:hypothetical protein